ncbi:hypothetical protein DPMN_102544 [Dreissena polymorpha]|uniref:Uncharacterized protein n=1 Tax=Dreissena polymorpha TaxID=45954 RepID=A0A9D4LN30_DREPO|nr:hypothetical protein DPMN_102544 [Dreissena polymorpha]
MDLLPYGQSLVPSCRSLKRRLQQSYKSVNIVGRKPVPPTHLIVRQVRLLSVNLPEFSRSAVSDQVNVGRLCCG